MDRLESLGPMLEINGINVFYGAIQALTDVSIKVEQGEIVSISHGGDTAYALVFRI